MCVQCRTVNIFFTENEIHFRIFGYVDISFVSFEIYNLSKCLFWNINIQNTQQKSECIFKFEIFFLYKLLLLYKQLLNT